MNLVYGENASVGKEDGMCVEKIRVGGAFKKIPLDLLTNPQPGDKV